MGRFKGWVILVGRVGAVKGGNKVLYLLRVLMEWSGCIVCLILRDILMVNLSNAESIPPPLLFLNHFLARISCVWAHWPLNIRPSDRSTPVIWEGVDDDADTAKWRRLVCRGDSKDNVFFEIGTA